MTSAATRETLRSREQSYKDAQLVCRALTYNEYLALARPQVRLQAAYADLFEHAMQALMEPDSQGFAQQSLETFQNHAGQFSLPSCSPLRKRSRPDKRLRFGGGQVRRLPEDGDE
jgi:hypothetical protein